MDLRDWTRPSRLRALLQLIEELPDACRWREAAKNDPDFMREQMLAEKALEKQRAQDGESKEKWAPRASEYDLTAQLLVQAVNLLGVIARGKTLNKVAWIGEPHTAREEVEKEAQASLSLSLIAQVTPHALMRGSDA